MSITSKTKHVLVLSDLHKGATISKFNKFGKALEKKIADADHIVLNGDVFELFDILNVIDASKAQFGIIKNAEEKMKKASDEAIAYLEELLAKYPEKKFHFVLGNHENLRYFTRRLDELQEKYDHFNWSPEAIKLGNALFTHGDLQMAGQVHGDNESQDPRSRGIVRLRHMEDVAATIEKVRKHKGSWFSDALQTVTERHRFSRAIAGAALSIPGLSDLMVKAGLFVVDKVGWRDSVEIAQKRMHDYLHDPKMTKDFHYLERSERQHKPFTLEGIKHVFFGHTHLPFDNQLYEGITYHNTGSLIKGQGIKSTEDIQALSFDLMPNGEAKNVRRAFGPSVGMAI